MLRDALIAAASAALLVASPAQAAPMPVHPYWDVEPIEGGCMASLKVDRATTFMILARPSGVGFGVGVEKPMKPGRQATLAVDGRQIAFTPDYGASRDVVFRPGLLSAPDLAAMRSTRSLALSVDGATIFERDVAERGLDEAVDAAQACARGEEGFWTEGAPPEADEAEPVLHAAGVWEMHPSDAEGVCVVQAELEGDRILQFLSWRGKLTLAVGAPDGVALPKGRRGAVRTDEAELSFTPEYSEPNYMSSAYELTAEQIAELRRTRTLELLVDDKAIASATFDVGDGYPEVIEDVLACSHGRAGWWSQGAPSPSSRHERGKLSRPAAASP